MSRKYYASHETKKLEIDFNQKNWRQDLAAFVKKKLNWDWRSTRVTRSKLISNEVKQFKIFDQYGRTIDIRYSEKNHIVYADNRALIDEYIRLRSFNY